MPKICLIYSEITSFTSIISFIANMIRNGPTTDDRTPIMRLWPINFLKTCHSVLKAPSKMSIGKNMARIP
jgi:hypothetical protein